MPLARYMDSLAKIELNTFHKSPKNIFDTYEKRLILSYFIFD